MTLADRIEDVIRRLGPLPLCVIATEVQKRRSDVLAVLIADKRFVHNGRRGPASRWDVRRATAVTSNTDKSCATFPPDYDVVTDALATLVREGGRTWWDAIDLASRYMSGARL